MSPPDAPPHRVAVIGDVAGHVEELRTELRRLGADPATGRLPADLTVVQVGDLVHRGPASDAVVDLVDGYLTHQPAHWVQLVGNHEAQYLREPAFDWPERISARSQATLRRWWAQGQMRAAASVRGDSESFLITHAGVTTDFWRGALAGQRDVELAASMINALIDENPDALFRAGAKLHARRLPGGARTGGSRADGSYDVAARAIGPVWAATAAELLPGWLGTTLPFSQVHGHDSIFDWQRRYFRANPDTDVADELARRTVVDEEAKHETTVLAGGRIIGVDPRHGIRPQHPWRAWEIPMGADQPVPGVGASGIE